MSIAVARPEDVPALVDLGEKLHASSDYARFNFDREKVGDLLDSLIAGHGVVFVAERFGEVVGGIAGAVTEFWFGRDLQGVDFSFYVHPEHRHGTIALRLLLAFEAWCKARGALEVRLGITTGLDVEGTARFYEWAGYTRNGVLFTKEL